MKIHKDIYIYYIILYFAYITEMYIIFRMNKHQPCINRQKVYREPERTRGPHDRNTGGSEDHRTNQRTTEKGEGIALQQCAVGMFDACRAG